MAFKSLTLLIVVSSFSAICAAKVAPPDIAYSASPQSTAARQDNQHDNDSVQFSLEKIDRSDGSQLLRLTDQSSKQTLDIPYRDMQPELELFAVEGTVFISAKTFNQTGTRDPENWAVDIYQWPNQIPYAELSSANMPVMDDFDDDGIPEFVVAYPYGDCQECGEWPTVFSIVPTQLQLRSLADFPRLVALYASDTHAKIDAYEKLGLHNNSRPRCTHTKLMQALEAKLNALHKLSS